MIHIQEASERDLPEVLLVESSAFGRDDEVELVKNLLADPSAKPILSLLAFKGNRPVGHILFTTAHLINSKSHASITILAPLAVVPDAQKQGIGGKLIEKGLQILSESGVDLVFVLGYPEYYLRHGFQPALPLGLEATYPIDCKHSDAWMVRFLRPNAYISGKVICADTLNKPEYWQE